MRLSGVTGPPAANAQSHSYDSILDYYVEHASEFSSRARANVYFPNPQSIFKGVQFDFVNVGSGNLTFLRRDMIASGRIPLVLARVYDSSSDGTEDFGPGWRLSASETISPGMGKLHLTTESGSVIDFVRDGENNFRLERDYPSDYLDLFKTAPDMLQASLRTGFVKEYKLIRGEFRPTRVTDRNGNVLLLIYENGLLAKMQNANHWIALTRGKKGHVVLAQDDLGRKVSYAYDEKGRLTEADDLGGNAWKYSYGDEGKLLNATDPLQRLNFAASFDGAGRVARLQLPSGTIHYLYDPASHSTTVIDKRQLTSRFFQNEDGITTRVINPLKEETSIKLDSGRNVTSLTRDGLLVERMEYDQQHRLVHRQSITDPGTVNHEYFYDPVTGLLSGIHPSGEGDENFVYDERGNLRSASLSDGPHSFEFSTTGDLVRFSLQTTNLAFTSDADGLIASMTDQEKAVTAMKYKVGGELEAATFPDGTRAEYKYQPSGLRAALAYKDGRRVEYGYDPAGNLTSTKVFDAKGKQVNGQKLEMNGSYQLTRWVLFDGTETTFEYDANGNLTQIAKGESITRFQYDALDRLVAVDTPDGQRLTYTYKPGERSLVEQYEHASLPVADLRDTGFTFSRPFATMDSRPLTAPFGAVRFSESLGSFQLANPDGSEIVRPHEGIESALSKLHLFQTGMTQKALRSGFNAPFNNMFVPAEYLAINCCPECYYSSPPPTVTIGSFSQNPILNGSTATVTVTVNPSASVNLAISSSGTGAATFNGQGGPTTMTISGTTTVTIYGSAASTNSGDLRLTASYNGTALVFSAFSVTSGACTLGGETDSGSGIKTCPSTVTLQSTYTVSQYCSTCKFQCISVHTDGTWTPSSGCSAVATHVDGSLTGGVTTSATGTFSASDCNWHYAYFVTQVTNAQGVVTNDTGGSIGLKCTSSPNGNPCP
jgi:YD repeat-containing protein